MAKNVTVKIGGIKCDFCTWFDMDVPYEKYPEYINKPCPYCGSNLLTEEDYVNCQTLVAYAEAMNEKKLPNKCKAKDRYMHVEMNGTGNMELIEMSKEEFNERYGGV